MTNTNLSSRSPVVGYVDGYNVRIAVQRLAKVPLAYVAARRSGPDGWLGGWLHPGGYFDSQQVQQQFQGAADDGCQAQPGGALLRVGFGQYVAGFVEGAEQGGQVVGVFGYLVGGPQFRRPVDGFRQSKQIPGPGLVRLAVFSVHRPERDVLHLGSTGHSDATGRTEHLVNRSAPDSSVRCPMVARSVVE